MKTGAARRLDPEPYDAPTPETFLEEIRRIIESGTLQGAREVAAQGLVHFPDHAELQRLHYELRPFEVRVNPSFKLSDPRPSYEWLKKNAKAFRGKWVGLDKGELVAAADTLEEVLQALQDRDPVDTLVHHIH
ncbi:MAG TPA: DUF5678 domain-containing protein [Thermoanaerobaculia bacterium]|nr:DUF5678 domain-containing protein [Thermoanaerobaculia bacterium]